MRTTIRFVVFFASGLFAYLFYMTGFVLLFTNGILPLMSLTDGQISVVVWGIIIFSAVSGGILFSYWFVNPIAVMLRCVRDISAGNFNQENKFQKIYNNRKLKMRYWLYREIISDIDSLGKQLWKAEVEREKLEQAKQDWVRGISHDIKTPLSYVVGYSSLLLSPDHSWTEEEQHNFLLQIQQKGNYIESLINNMNLFFRLEDPAKPLPMEVEVFDFIPFIKDLAADILNQYSNKDYPISIEVLDERLNIEGDQQLLYRAITNIINNAIFHNPVGTKIQIVVKRIEQDRVRVSICDKGVGISQEIINSQMNGYSNAYEADKKDYARGLGLSIVNSIMKAHKGSVFIESEDGKGSVFHVSLPMQQNHS